MVNLSAQSYVTNLIRTMRGPLQSNPQYIWTSDDYLEIAALAKNIVGLWSNARFVGIGHSPSYLIYGMDCLSQDQNSKLETVHVPFSARYLDEDKKLSDKYTACFRSDTQSPFYELASANRQFYRQFLERRGMSPQAIMADFKQGRTTILIDNVQSGASFASFIHCLYSWANDMGIRNADFSEAVKCMGLTDTHFPSTIKISEVNLKIKITTLKISSHLGHALIGVKSCENDRFVPTYYSIEWDRPPVEIAEQNRCLVEQIKHFIGEAIQNRLPPTPTLSVPSRQSGNLTLLDHIMARLKKRYEELEARKINAKKFENAGENMTSVRNSNKPIFQLPGLGLKNYDHK